MTANAIKADWRAIEVAREIHRMAEPEQTILFGSRARGDHRPDSDIDVLIISKRSPTEEWLDDLRDRARKVQKARLPEASGIDVICMTVDEFAGRRHLRNNLANSIAKQGARILPQENTEPPEESIDWDDVDGKINDAVDAANALTSLAEAGILHSFPDKQFGRIAQNALENAYKAVLGAHGFEYPTSGGSGHNLRIITERIRQHRIIPDDVPMPGEEHRYLTEFGGAALYSHEHLPLDKEAIARDVPLAVAALRALVERAKSAQ
jgi:predicted nucleotidyltransferase